MLTVQSLPYVATISAAVMSAVSNAERARIIASGIQPTVPTPPEPEPLAKAA
jgi:hypothetical protein